MRYSDNSSRTFSFWRDAKDVRCWPPPGFGEGSRSASPIWDMAGSDWGMVCEQPSKPSHTLRCHEPLNGIAIDIGMQLFLAPVGRPCQMTLGESAAAQELQGTVIWALQARCWPAIWWAGSRVRGVPCTLYFSYAAIRLARESQHLGVRHGRMAQLMSARQLYDTHA